MATSKQTTAKEKAVTKPKVVKKAVAKAPAKSKTVKAKVVAKAPTKKTSTVKVESKFDKQALNPTITKGSHLTVIKYPNGKTELIWDDEALARDVAEAIAEYQASKPKDKKPAVKAKATRSKKAVQ